MLLMLPFVTITDYLYELRTVARLMQPLGPGGLLYLAAAVSDFFVPPDRMAEHKIQSTDAADTVRDRAQGTGINVRVAKEDKRAANGAGTEDEAFDNFDSFPKLPRSKRLVIDLDPVPKVSKYPIDEQTACPRLTQNSSSKISSTAGRPKA
jgi:phosphopantothenate---cysteine ligase (ATP)